MATDAAEDALLLPRQLFEARYVIGHGSTAKVYFLAPSALSLNNFRLVISFFSSTSYLRRENSLELGPQGTILTPRPLLFGYFIA